MSFLDVIPHSLFRMLSSPACVRNAIVLERIYEQFFDDFSFAPKKAEVLQVIRQVLDDPAIAPISDEDEGGSATATNEYTIYNRLRDDGWVMEVADRRNVEVHMPREAHALMSALITLKEELRVNISAEASLIDSGILAAYQDPAGKVMNIVSARRQAIQLRRSIDGVLTSLHRIEEELMKSDGLADLLGRFMDHFVEKLLLQDYRLLKASAYNPMRFQRSIRANTERFMNDEGQISRAAVALADQGLAPDIKSAQAQILQDLSRIRDVFVNLGNKLDLIDRFSHKLERRIATTVRYQETGRNVREESLRNAIRLAFAQLDAGDTTCISPCVGLPVPYSTATLALPKKAREPVQPQTRIAKTVDPADLMRETMIDSYVAHMAVTKNVVVNRLLEIANSDSFSDLDAFEPKDARDVAILYEARAGTLEDLPGIEMRIGNSEGRNNTFVTGPAVLIRRQENKK
jgi:Wadjet anti plasmid transformation system JetA-like protein